MYTQNTIPEKTINQLVSLIYSENFESYLWERYPNYNLSDREGVNKNYTYILSFIKENYFCENITLIKNLLYFFLYGKLEGTDTLLILPVDQGFEHGPHRSFEKNEEGFDPIYHYNLAKKSGLSAFAAPLGIMELVHTYKQNSPEENNSKYSNIPLVLKINSNDYFSASNQNTDPDQAIIADVDDAIRLGCIGIGITIYPGSANFQNMAEKLSYIIRKAKKEGLVVIIWAYPRGSSLRRSNNGIEAKEAPNTVDVVSYAAHIACLMGAHIVKVKMPSYPKTYWKDLQLNQKLCDIEREGVINPEDKAEINTSIEDFNAKKCYERNKFFIQEIRKSCFNGRRFVIFSGGLYTKSDEDILSSVKSIGENMGSGSIIGRNIFQREEQEAIKLINKIINSYIEAFESK